MANTDSFFKKLIGYHDMTVNGGSLLPRRFLLNFVRGIVQDVGGATQIAISDEPVWLATTVLTGNQNDFTANGFPGSSEVPFDPTGATRTLTGFEFTGLNVFEKRVWNLSTDSRDLLITNNDAASSPANRVLTNTGASITITPGNAVKLVRSADNANWRGVLCLI